MDKILEKTLDDGYKKLLSCIGFEPTAVDTMVVRTKFAPEVVASMLLQLELQGHIKSMPGGYCRVS